MYNDIFHSDRAYIKLFLEKWFIPKYGVIIKDCDLIKVLKIDNKYLYI